MLDSQKRRRLTTSLLDKTAAHGLLDPEELKEFRWHQRNIAMMSMFSMSMLPAQIIVWYSVRQDPVQQRSMIVKSTVLFGFVALGMVSSGRMQTNFLTKLQEKYLSGLNDEQLRTLKHKSADTSLESRV